MIFDIMVSIALTEIEIRRMGIALDLSQSARWRWEAILIKFGKLIQANPKRAVREVAVAGFSVNCSTDPMGEILGASGLSVRYGHSTCQQHG